MAGAAVERDLVEMLRKVVVAAEGRLEDGHSELCQYAVALDEEEDDALDEGELCDCGHVDLRAEVGAVRGSGVLG